MQFHSSLTGVSRIERKQCLPWSGFVGPAPMRSGKHELQVGSCHFLVSDLCLIWQQAFPAKVWGLYWLEHGSDSSWHNFIFPWPSKLGNWNICGVWQILRYVGDFLIVYDTSERLDKLQALRNGKKYSCRVLVASFLLSRVTKMVSFDF